MKKEAKKCHVLILKKDISNVKNTLLKWILKNILENQTPQRTEKFIMVDFYEMDFMKGIAILVKVDKMYETLKSLLTNRFWFKDKGEIG